MILRASLTWVVLAIIGVANGILRGVTYGRHTSERTAHQISTITCIAGVFAGAYLMMRNVVTGLSVRSLFGLGAAWSLATVVFEFGFGRFVARESWSSLLRSYDLRTGQVWSAVPLAILISPLIVNRLAVQRCEDRALSDSPTPVDGVRA